jgi:type I restriction enzyme, S subunit
VTWREWRVREMADLINGFPFDSAEFSDHGELPLVRIRDILGDSFETFVSLEVVPESAIVRDEDVVVGMDGDFNVVHWSRGAAALNQRLCLLRSNGRADTRFLAYALPAHLQVINDLTYATTVKHLSSGQVRSIRMTAPDLPEQRAISDYLDRETARIDTLIEEQQRLIEMLRERRHGVVRRVVGGGLDNAPTKSSGLHWVAQVPDHWTVGNIRRFAQMKTGHTPSRSNPDLWVDCTIPWVTLADVWQLRDGTVTWLSTDTNSRISEFGLANSAAELLPAGTVVLSRTASVGFTGIMPVPMATSQDYWNWVCGRNLLPEFLVWVFRAMRNDILGLMIGSTHKTIYQPVAAGIAIPVPPTEEQQRIVAHLDEQTAKIDNLIGETERFIELSRERRAALITAAVTGQIDVRGEVA